VAALAALAVLGRLAFTPIPNVKPTTDIAIFSGYALGALPGFVVGATAALVSILRARPGALDALGRWWPGGSPAWVARCSREWPVAGSGAGRCRVLRRDGLRARGDHGHLPDHGYGACRGSPAGSRSRARPSRFNLAHATGNVAFCLLIGPSFVHAIGRFRRRFVVRWEAPAAASVALLAGLALAAPQPAQAASSTQRALSYLTRAQNSDGGFGAAPGQSSGQLYTGWAALGLAAAGANPSSVTSHGASPIAYIGDRAGQLNDIGDLERTILVLATSGASPRSFRGRDLVAELERRRKSSGSFDGTIDHAAFGILALRAAGAGGLTRDRRVDRPVPELRRGFASRRTAAAIRTTPAP